jgi:hypothetical protein
MIPGRQSANALADSACLGVIAGLDPAIHPTKMFVAKRMDTRVKPAYDVNLF